MATSKQVACVKDGCELEGVVYEIPFAMLMSEDEVVMCGGCGEEAPTVLGRKATEPVNAGQVAEIAALGRTTFLSSDEPLPI